jgi:hypothetical protein
LRVIKVLAPCDPEVHLYKVGDEHTGTKHHAARELAKTVERIRADPVARWIGMGDKCEFITPSDPRWDGGAICDWVSPDNIAIDQCDYYCDVMAPIADKCDGLLWGNHEYEIRRHSHIDVQKYICKKLGVQDLSFQAWIHYTFKATATQTTGIDVIVTHGAGSARTRGAKMNRLEWLMNAFGGDIFGHGHMHDVILHPGMPYLVVTRDGKLKQKRKMGAVTGCYFRTYTQDVESSYGEQKNYPPTIIGSPMFRIAIDKNANATISVTA